METTLEQCPLCGSDLSQTKFREIRAKIRDQERRNAEELTEAKQAITHDLEAELKKEFEQQRKDAEKKLRDEADKQIKKALGEREEVVKKLKEAEAREAETRKQAQLQIHKERQAAESRANALAEQQIKKIAAERDLATKKVKEVQEREAQIRKQAEQEAETLLQKELMEQRQILERHEKLALLKLQSDFNRERESLQKKLERKTANELGDHGEINVFEALRDRFQGDKIHRIPKGEEGADIRHEVIYKGELCGTIITDAKNRQSWQNLFVTKLRRDQVEAGAEHAILATAVFPAGKRDFCIESGVIVISPGGVVYITEILRQAMVTMHIKGLSLKQRSNKMSQLYKLITSELYSSKFAEAQRLTQDILDLDVQEQKDHSIVWRKRGTLGTRIKNVLRAVETDVAAVIERDGEGEDLATMEVKRVAS